jgi:two-component system nitrate/nitrite response regulator NarL
MTANAADHATARPIRLVIIDDHVMFREGLARSIADQDGIEVVGQYSSSSEALPILASTQPTLVILDVNLGTDRAIDFVTGARQNGFKGQILIVTAGVGDAEAVRLIHAGVAGIMHKQHSTEDLCNAIRQVARGEACLENQYLSPLFRSLDQSRSRPRLEERDKMVLRLILRGLTNREIAEELESTEGAINAVLHHLFKKLGVRTRAQLVKVVLENHRDDL